MRRGVSRFLTLDLMPTLDEMEGVRSMVLWQNGRPYQRTALVCQRCSHTLIDHHMRYSVRDRSYSWRCSVSAWTPNETVHCECVGAGNRARAMGMFDRFGHWVADEYRGLN